MKSIVLVIALGLGGTTCAAQEVFVVGGGSESCGKWIASRANPRVHIPLKQWLFGFLSGSNWYSNAGDTRVMDTAAVIAYVDHYCKNNPFHVLALASAAAVQESGGPKASHQWQK